MDRPLRVDVHNGAPVWGGAEVATARLVAGLDRRGHDVLLYCNDPEVVERAAGIGAPAIRLVLAGDLALHDAFRFAVALRGRRPDALLITTFRKLWLGGLAGRLGGVDRTVARVGLETDTPRSAKYRFALRRWVDAVVFNAETMRTAFKRQVPDYDGDLVTIHTGIRPVEPAGGVGLRSELGIPVDAVVVGSVGRLASQKRYDRLVGAAADLPPHVHVLIAGEGPERALLERTAADRGVADRVHLPGHRADVGPVLDALDIFVLTSDREGMSNAMIEALSAGVPVVSTAVSGAREALEPLPDADSAPGRILASPAELTATLAPLISDADARRRMGEVARQVARSRFDEERMLDEWERVLRGDVA